MGILEDLGWDDGWRAAWDGFAHDDTTVPARVVSVHRDRFVVGTAEGERSAELSGRLRHRATEEGERPAVGDWVAVRLPRGDGASIVHGVLPRRTHLARKVPGALTAVQVVAANVEAARAGFEYAAKEFPPLARQKRKNAGFHSIRQHRSLSTASPTPPTVGRRMLKN